MCDELFLYHFGGREGQLSNIIHSAFEVIAFLFQTMK